MTLPPPPHDPAIASAYEAGRARLVDTRLDLEAFAARIQAIQVDTESLASYGADLFVATACLAGDPSALRLFEALYVANVPTYVARLGLPPEVVEEVQQTVRVQLLSGAEPKLRSYLGKGPLSAWVRVVANRSALNLLEARKPDQLARDSDAVETLLDGQPGLELQALRARYQARVQTAFERAFGALTARERTILRMNVVDGKSIDVISAVYRTHRATVARWLQAIRGKLVEEIRRELSLDLGATASEAQSLIQLFRAELKVSLDRLFEK